MINEKGVYNTMIVYNREWSGIMKLSIFALNKILNTKADRLRFDIRVHKDQEQHYHLFSIQKKEESVVVSVDRKKKDVALVEYETTNHWAVQNAVRDLLNKIYK